ncbi:MAG: restriction endonuclease [Ardenticatenales bacterium]|nr:restriction endonuclease [Ardenticatenales bacterium]
MKAVDTLSQAIQLNIHFELVSQFADTVVDAYYDSYADIAASVLRTQLARASRQIHEMLGPSHVLSDIQQSALLSKLALVLRVKAISQLSFGDRHEPLERALRTAEKAVSLDPSNPGARLEFANCYWGLTRYAASDTDYMQQVSLSEEQYLEAVKTTRNEMADLSLARFYRLTFQTSKACDTYAATRSYISNRRLLLREAHIFAEASQNLWYRDYPESYLNPYLVDAIRDTQSAIDSGFGYARHIVNLAVLYAMTGDMDGSQTILASGAGAGTVPSTGTHLRAWLQMMYCRQMATTSQTRGLALGLTDPMVLNRLGTYMIDFQAKPDVALAFYNAAERLAPKSAIILTNKARLLISAGDRSRVDEVERLLQRASSYADRRFTWWRAYRNTVAEWRGRSPRPKAGRASVDLGSSFLTRRAAFHRIEALASPNDRGLQFERFVAAIIKTSFTTSSGSHTIPGAQHDAFFMHQDKPFLVEVKWESSPVDPGTMREFIGGLDVVGLNGVFISMRGFGVEAVNSVKKQMTNRCILLIDGEEMRQVVEGAIPFNQLVDFKYFHFYRNRDPYRKLPVEKRTLDAMPNGGRPTDLPA